MPAPGGVDTAPNDFVRKMRREIFKHTQFLLPKNHHTGSPIFLPMWWLCFLLNCKSLESYNSSTISFTLIAIFRAFFYILYLLLLLHKPSSSSLSQFTTSTFGFFPLYCFSSSAKYLLLIKSSSAACILSLETPLCAETLSMVL